jgi:hypothetical protein
MANWKGYESSRGLFEVTSPTLKRKNGIITKASARMIDIPRSIVAVLEILTHRRNKPTKLGSSDAIYNL